MEDRRCRPALLAAIRDPGGALIGVEATLLGWSGRRATVGTPRRVIGCMRGGAVRLDAPWAGALLLAEGVASALSASQALGFPAWAALSAANLASFAPPAGVQRLLIAADPDPTGREAAQRLQARLASLSVQIVYPPDGREDWCGS